MFQYGATMIRVVDGDTIWLDVDLGFQVHQHVDVRLAYINAPEKVNFTLTGLQDHAMNHIQKVLPVGAFCVIDVLRPEKYGRYLAVVHYLVGSTKWADVLALGTNLNDELVKLGYAVRYKD